jgi:predicted ATPase
VLVAGYSGVGKTSLVNQLREIKEHAYLISGKYDFSKRDVPYSGVVSAFTDMIHQVSYLFMCGGACAVVRVCACAKLWHNRCWRKAKKRWRS